MSLYKSGKVELLSADFDGVAAPAQAAESAQEPQLLFGQGAGRILEVSSEDGARTAENLRAVRGGCSDASAAWVSQSHEQEHVTVDFGDVFQVTKVVLKPYYSKRYAIKYMDAAGKWRDYQEWTDASEGDDIQLLELDQVVTATQMQLLVDQGRRTSWKVFNVHGRALKATVGRGGWTPHAGPTVLGALEHAALDLDLFDDAPLERIAVSDYGTVAVSARGGMSWWGCRPWALRQARLKAMARNNFAATFARLYAAYERTFADPLQVRVMMTPFVPSYSLHTAD